MWPSFAPDNIILTYLSNDPIPAGCELDFEPAMNNPRAAAALTARGMATAFAVLVVPAAAQAVAFVSPYKAGDFRGPNPLSPVSVARMVKTEGDASGGGDRDFGMEGAMLARVLGVVPEAENRVGAPEAATVLSAAALAEKQLRNAAHAPDHDFGRIQAEMAELELRHRDHGMDTKPQDPNVEPAHAGNS